MRRWDFSADQVASHLYFFVSLIKFFFTELGMHLHLLFIFSLFFSVIKNFSILHFLLSEFGWRLIINRPGLEIDTSSK